MASGSRFGIGRRRRQRRREDLEAAPAHVVGDEIEAAYARSDLLERRRRLMDAWSTYLGQERRE